MKQTTDGEGEDLAFVLGWGNRPGHENVRWLIDAFADAGYRVHAFELPRSITDFEAEYVRPVREAVADLDSFRLVGHSTGGLIGPFVDGAETRTYLSPWWGFPAHRRGPLLRLLSRLPIERPILPSGTTDRSALGELATDRQIADGPDRAAPTFLREARWAHTNLPPIDDDAVVFCSLTDPIVSIRSIGQRVPAERIRLYDGGHELFSSRSREQHLDSILAAVDRGTVVED